MRTAKKLSFENSVVITNRVAVDLPRIEAALKALAIKTNDPICAQLAGQLGTVLANWANIEGLVVTDKALEFRKRELAEMKAKQALKAGKSVESDDDDGFDL